MRTGIVSVGRRVTTDAVVARWALASVARALRVGVAGGALLCTGILALQAPVQAQDAAARRSAAEHLLMPSEGAPASVLPRLRLERGVATTDGGSAGTWSSNGYLLPALLSAAIPGAGEISMGHWWNGLPLVAAEVATWIGYAHFGDQGHRLRDDYEAYADAHWNFDTWQQNLEMYYDLETNPVVTSRYDFWDPASPYNCDCSPPFIPADEDLQEYYENAGKYVQFWPGWDDWVFDAANPGRNTSDNRNTYVGIRIDSNQNFDNATRMLGVAAATRVISVIQSIWLVRRADRDDGLRLEPMTFRGLGTGMRLTLKY